MTVIVFWLVVITPSLHPIPPHPRYYPPQRLLNLVTETFPFLLHHHRPHSQAQHHQLAPGLGQNRQQLHFLLLVLGFLLLCHQILTFPLGLLPLQPELLRCSLPRILLLLTLRRLMCSLGDLLRLRLHPQRRPSEWLQLLLLRDPHVGASDWW